MERKTKMRLMHAKDISELSKIYVRVYTDFDVGECWDIESAKKLMKYWYQRQPDLCLVAELDNKLVGCFMAGIKPWWDGNHLVDGELFVDPTYQKHGIGTQLSVAIYKAALKKYNVISFDATTFKRTKFPLSWYKSQGYEVNKEWVLISGEVKKALKTLSR